MGEFVSGVAATLLGKLANKAYEETVLVWGLKDNIEKLQKSIKMISAFLIDAENKQFKDKGITEWLQQLKYVFYDASDILDEIECEAKLNETVKGYGSVARKVRRFCSCSNPFVFRVKMGHKIKDIREKIDEIASYGTKFGLTEHQYANAMTLNQELQRRETHSYVPSRVTGRDEEKEEIVSFLMRPSIKNMDVIPIVGMGGLGKTTLAQVAYNDKRVIDHFELRVWVHVGDDFNLKGLMSKILKGPNIINSGGADSRSLDELQTLVRGKLESKKFLLVLDDVWSHNAKTWHELMDILLGTTDGERNSKIIVTTRSHEVASVVGTIPEVIINLGELPEGESLILFVKCAFQGGEQEAERHPRLKKIGQQIVRKCKGVPLAVVTLGCLLKSQSQYDENEWKKIRDSEVWEIDHQQHDGILPALRLSYTHLPSHLKQCFSYCAVLPKNLPFLTLDLIAFWMAHGLLQPTNESEDFEYLGELYLKQLTSSSFFQQHTVFSDRESAFGSNFEKIVGFTLYKMHDLVHDLAILTMRGEQAVITSNPTYVINENVRHLSLSRHGDQIPSLPHKLNKVRAFATWPPNIEEPIIVTEPFMRWVSKEFKFLRLLDLKFSSFESLPDCFGKMKHLRYLNLMACVKMKRLPDSICKLHNLQSLNLWGCTSLQELPKKLRNLVNLQILVITARVRDLYSIDIKCFKSLQMLYLFDCPNLEVLPRDLRHLIALKRLIIFKCPDLAHFEDQGEEEEGRGKHNEVITDLSLQKFSVVGAPKLAALPNWLARSAKTLESMVIEMTTLTSLPEWLPKLTSLDTLYIRFCPLLLSLPEDMGHLRNLQHLYIEECPQLVARCEKDKGPEWSKIAHVPNIHLRSGLSWVQ